MALPHRRQQLAKFIPFHDLTREQVARAIGGNTVRVQNLAAGHVYPSPTEIAALELLFGLPVEVLFDSEMLVYRESWPPPRGFEVAVQAEAERRTAGE